MWTKNNVSVNSNDVFSSLHEPQFSHPVSGVDGILFAIRNFINFDTYFGVGDKSFHHSSFGQFTSITNYKLVQSE